MKKLSSFFIKIYQLPIKLLFSIALFLPLGNVFAQANTPSPLHFPTPKKTANMLFYLQRDPNINTLIYSLNLDERNNLIKSAPVRIHWIRYTENNKIKELNYIQRKFAYGLETKEIAKDKYELKFVSHKNLAFYLQKNKDEIYQVVANINNKTIKINRFFIRIDGGTFWVPNVKYVQLEGTDEQSGKSVKEQINIKKL